MIKFQTYIIVLVLGLFSFKHLQAQKKGGGLKVPNLRKFDEKKFHFGFTLGFNNNRFNTQYNLEGLDELNRSEGLYKLENPWRPGFTLGLVSEFHLVPQYLSLRFVPEIAFEDRMITYRYTGEVPGFEETELIKVNDATFIHFPLELKLRSKRIHNFAAYLIGGAMYSIDVANKKKIENDGLTRDEQVLRTKQGQAFGRVGVGFDFFLPYFKFGIEFKVGLGFDNVLLEDNTSFVKPLNSLKNRTFNVVLTFEG